MGFEFLVDLQLLKEILLLCKNSTKVIHSFLIILSNIWNVKIMTKFKVNEIKGYRISLCQQFCFCFYRVRKFCRKNCSLKIELNAKLNSRMFYIWFYFGKLFLPIPMAIIFMFYDNSSVMKYSQSYSILKYFFKTRNKR